MEKASNSQNSRASLGTRIEYLVRLLGLHIERLRNPGDFEWLAQDVELYRRTYNEFTGEDLSNASILEIGFGQRPYNMTALHSLGYNVVGVDLDRPLEKLTFSAMREIIERNGMLRCAKTVGRRVVFDNTEYRGIDAMLQRKFGKPLKRLEERQLIVGDATHPATWDRMREQFDFVYSEDVLEHIPAEVLAIELLHHHMKDGAVAIISPMIFTGISGGHDLGWYPSVVDQPDGKRGPAWGHLTGETPPTDSFLNKVTRAQYRELFAPWFVIEREELVYPGLGSSFLTEERRRALSGYDEDELFSNKVRFVLRKKSTLN